MVTVVASTLLRVWKLLGESISSSHHNRNGYSCARRRRSPNRGDPLADAPVSAPSAVRTPSTIHAVGQSYLSTRRADLIISSLYFFFLDTFLSWQMILVFHLLGK